MKSNRVTLLFWEGYLSVSPSLLNAVDLLTKAGFQVDIVLREPDREYAALPTLPNQLRILSFRPIRYRLKHFAPEAKPVESGGSPFRRMMALLQRVQSIAINHIFLLIEFFQFVRLAMRSLSPSPAAIIGVDMMGLAAAGLARAWAGVGRVPLIYWSLELAFYADMRSPLNKGFKLLERRFNRRAAFTLIQDKDRAAALVEENHISPESMLLVPNSPYGDPLPTEERNYFHRKFNLPELTRVILHAGMIEPHVLALEMAQAAGQWDNSFALVLHDRMKRSPDEPYLRAITQAGGSHVFLSLDPVPLHELDRVMSSAAIGLVLYRQESGLNFSLMAGASGKMGFYLRCGVPVICINFPVFRPLFDEYHCGLLVDDPSGIESAAKEIIAHYSEYSQNALKCYHEVLDFSAYFRPVIDRIRQFVDKSE